MLSRASVPDTLPRSTASRPSLTPIPRVGRPLDGVYPAQSRKVGFANPSPYPRLGFNPLADPGPPGSQPRFPAGAGALRPHPTEADSEGQDTAGPEMAPPAGGSATASDPGSAAVLLAVHAAVRPLAAGPDAEAQLRRLQLSADPERPGRFRLELLGAGPGAVSGSGAGPRPGGLGGTRSPKPGPSPWPLSSL